MKTSLIFLNMLFIAFLGFGQPYLQKDTVKIAVGDLVCPYFENPNLSYVEVYFNCFVDSNTLKNTFYENKVIYPVRVTNVSSDTISLVVKTSSGDTVLELDKFILPHTSIIGIYRQGIHNLGDYVRTAVIQTHSGKNVNYSKPVPITIVKFNGHFHAK